MIARGKCDTSTLWAEPKDRHGSPKDADGLLRHRDCNTTLKHYQKILEEGVINAAVTWDGVLNGPLQVKRQLLGFCGVAEIFKSAKSLDRPET